MPGRNAKAAVLHRPTTMRDHQDILKAARALAALACAGTLLLACAADSTEEPAVSSSEEGLGLGKIPCRREQGGYYYAVVDYVSVDDASECSLTMPESKSDAYCANYCQETGMTAYRVPVLYSANTCVIRHYCTRQ